MHITVAICTWNRAKLLDQTLTQMRNLQIPEGVTWELLVVNNNCTDETDAVLARHADELPLARLLEMKQGHSHARNCAIEAAKGELLLWTDDDVLVAPEWLAAYVASARKHPEAAIFGGQIDPWFECDPPQWITRRLADFAGPLVINTPHNDDIPFGPEEVPFGANMAFRTHLLKASPFDPRLGRRGSLILGNDDTTKIRELLAAGWLGRWVPGAVLKHYVVASRLTPKYIRRFISGHRQTEILVDGTDGHGGNRFPWWALRMYCEGLAKSTLGAIASEEIWYRGLRARATAEGTIIGTWRRWTQIRSQRSEANRTAIAG